MEPSKKENRIRIEPPEPMGSEPSLASPPPALARPYTFLLLLTVACSALSLYLAFGA